MTRFFTRFQTVVQIYRERLSAFHPNARLYLGSVILTGAAMGVYRLLFNFFILSQGFDEALLGMLVTTSSMTALLAALPMGYVSDMLSRRFALILGGCMIVVSVVGMVLWPTLPVLIAMNVLVGLAQSLAGVTMGPFLMENSGEKERTYLFSLTSGIQMASAFVGNWVGGYLPTWISGLKHFSATSSTAYGGSLLIIAGGAALGVLPLLFLRTPKAGTQRSLFAPFNFFRKQPRLLTQLILPMLVTSIGAGLIMPFMNVFFRNVYHQPDPVIGSMFAWGSLAMGIGMIVAPPLGDRYGKIKVVVFTQGLSIPFLVMLGFSPVFALSAAAYFIRLALMNMSGPIYQTFVMENVEPGARGTVASLVSMANSFGWAFSPIISGWLQVRSGFSLPFLGTILLYIVSVYLYWSYFLHKKDLKPDEAPSMA
jgi:MFS family permease